MLTSASVYRDSEWDIVHRIAQPGDSWTPLARRNGVVMQVPADAEAFKRRYPYSPVTPADATEVFVYRPFQITLSGRMSHGGGECVSIVDNMACAYPADSWQAKLSDTPPLHFPDGSEFFCCMPQETMLMWEREALIMGPSEATWVGDYPAKRRRVVLVQGMVLINGVGYIGPTVVHVQPGDRIESVGKVYAAQVWI